MKMQTILFVGGTRSGKSALAQRWAESRAAQRLFIATAQARDADFAQRIAQHQAQRGTGWTTLEEPLALVSCLRHAHAPVIVVDCITLWLCNMLEQSHDAPAILEAVDTLTAWLCHAPVPVALVTAEVGCGVVPVSALGRAFCDIQGAANQRLAVACNTVLLVHCGLPLALKDRIPEVLCPE